MPEKVTHLNQTFAPIVYKLKRLHVVKFKKIYGKAKNFSVNKR